VPCGDACRVLPLISASKYPISNPTARGFHGEHSP
jgi:hypothetical protein